jgi:hypothetical protein
VAGIELRCTEGKQDYVAYPVKIERSKEEARKKASFVSTISFAMFNSLFY